MARKKDGREKALITYRVPWSSEKPHMTVTFLLESLLERRAFQAALRSRKVVFHGEKGMVRLDDILTVNLEPIENG